MNLPPRSDFQRFQDFQHFQRFQRFQVGRRPRESGAHFQRFQRFQRKRLRGFRAEILLSYYLVGNVGNKKGGAQSWAS